MTRIYTRTPLEDRFWPKVEKRASADCWQWIGSKSVCGPGFTYGRLWDYERGKIAAHRVSYELHNGAIPAGYHVHHTCGNTLCVNPSHLQALSSPDHRRVTPNQHARKTHCKYGHELTPDNLLKNRSGHYPGRRCKTCHNLRSRLAKQQRREQGAAAS